MTRRFTLLLVEAAVGALVLAMAGMAVAQSAGNDTIRCDPRPPKTCEGRLERAAVTPTDA